MTSTWDELKFYGQLARNLFAPSHDLHKIPGPPGYWGLGHIPKIMRPDYHVQILEWANEYGGIFKFSLGCQWVVVVSDPALAAQILGRGADSVPRKSVGYQFFDLATNNLGARSFFTTSDEKQWSGVRKAAAPAFSMANVRRSFPHALKHAQHIVEQCMPAQGSGFQQGGAATAAGPAGAVDIQEHLELALLNVFVEALFEVPPSEFPGHEVAHAMNLVLEEANERLKVPLRGLATSIAHPGHYKAVNRAQQLLGKVYGELADLVRNRPEPADNDTNLWACLARIKDYKTGKPLSRKQLIPEIGALMMAGFDTSSHTIAWCLYTLAAHPEHQHKVHQELLAKELLQHGGAGSREPTMDDLYQLAHLNCVIDETMRMYPVAATASVREITRPVRVGQYTIPQGVIVWPMLYALHNAQHNWEQPEEFRPDRWADKYLGLSTRNSVGADSNSGDTDTDKPPSSKTHKAFLPFSDGIKNCLGQNLGLMEVRTVLVALLSHFRFELHPDMGGADQVKKSQIMSLTLKIKGGLRVLCHPLEQASEHAYVSSLRAKHMMDASRAGSDIAVSSPSSPSSSSTDSSSLSPTSSSPTASSGPGGVPSSRMHHALAGMLLGDAEGEDGGAEMCMLLPPLPAHLQDPAQLMAQAAAMGYLTAPQGLEGVEGAKGKGAPGSGELGKTNPVLGVRLLQQQEVQEGGWGEGGWGKGWLQALRRAATRRAQGGPRDGLGSHEVQDEDLQVE